MTITFQVDANAPLVAPPGFLLAGAWINLLLYSMEILVGSYYVLKTRGWKVKTLVTVALLVDTVGTISVCQYTWVALLTPNKPVKAVAEPFLLNSIMSTFSASIEQSYFAYRVWTITRKKFITSLLGAMIFIPLVCVLTSIALALELGPEVDQIKLATLNIVATLLVVSTDVIMAVYLVYKLRCISLLQFSHSTKSLIRKIMSYTVACGLITACFSIVTTTLTFTSIGPFLLFFDCNGRVYTLTILLNFLLFHDWRRDYDEKRRSSLNDNDNTDFRWKGSSWSRRFTSSQSSAATPRYPPSVLRRSRSSVSVMRTEIQGAAFDIFQKPTPGPPFSIESIFSKSDEDLGLA